MRSLGWYFMAGGFLMFPMVCLGLGAFAAGVLLPVLGWVGKSRRLPFVGGLALLGGGVLLIALGTFGFFLQMSEVESAIALSPPDIAKTIMSLGYAESRVCLITGIGCAIVPLAGAALLLPIGKAEPTALRRVLAIGLAIVVLAVGAFVVRGQVAQHKADLAAAASFELR